MDKSSIQQSARLVLCLQFNKELLLHHQEVIENLIFVVSSSFKV